MMGGTNPMSNSDDESNGTKSDQKKIESVAGCKLIGKDDFDEIMDVMVGLEDNKARINYLDIQKQPYLFNSEMMMKLLSVTESVKDTHILYREHCSALDGSKYQIQ